MLEQSKHLDELRKLYSFEWNLSAHSSVCLDDVANLCELRELLAGYGSQKTVDYT